MYHVSFFNGAGALSGLRQGTKESGADFNCTSTYCYPIGAANQMLFMRLQAALNVAAKLKGIATQIGPDGNIGPATILLAKAVAAKLSATELARVWTLSQLYSVGNITKEGLASSADKLTPELEQFVDRTSPAAVASYAIQPQTQMPSAGVQVPSAPIPMVPIRADIPITPGISQYTMSPSGQVPSAGPYITIPSPGVTLPGPNPSAGSAPGGAGMVVVAPAKPNVGMMIGLGVLGVGLIAGIVWARSQTD